jgi:hypothetical protein
MPDPVVSSTLRASLERGDLGTLDPRTELVLLRAFVADAVARDTDLGPFFRALADVDALALVDLTTGPRAPAGPALVRGALQVLEVLEEKVAPSGLYRRLAALAGSLADEVIRVAARRHPAASWLVGLSGRAEGPAPGLLHLGEIVGHPSFVHACWRHAEAGHHVALRRVAESFGRPEPIAALLSVGADEWACEAAARFLERPGGPSLAPWVCAVWGPEPDGFFVRVVPLLGTPEALEALAREAEDCPRTRAFLRIRLGASGASTVTGGGV